MHVEVARAHLSAFLASSVNLSQSLKYICDLVGTFKAAPRSVASLARSPDGIALAPVRPRTGSLHRSSSEVGKEKLSLAAERHMMGTVHCKSYSHFLD